MYPSVYAKGVKSDFVNFFDQTPKNNISKAIMFTKSRGANEEYIIPMTLPGVSRLLDEVEFQEVFNKSYTISNVDWAVGIRESRNTIEDAKEYTGGMITNQVAKAAQGFARLPIKEVSTLMESTSGLAFDGVTFFSTSRTLAGSGVLDNVLASTNTMTSLTDITAVYARAKTALLSFKDKNGDPFNPMPELAVICSPQNEDVWQKLLVAREDYTATDSIYRGTAQVIVNPYLSTAKNTAYLVDLSQGNAFIWQEREPVKAYMEDDQKTPFVEFFWKSRAGVGYGMPTSIVKMTS